MLSRNRCLDLLLVLALLATFALAAPARVIEKCGATVHHNSCTNTFECKLTKGHEGSHVVPEHDCPRKTTCPSCQNVTVECDLKCGHNYPHTRVPYHDCKRMAQCPHSGCYFSERCVYGECGHSGPHHVSSHDCRQMAHCSRCTFTERCIEGNCGHGGSHKYSKHLCRRTVDCPNCSYSQCKYDCGHEGEHAVKKHQCAIVGKCTTCRREQRCARDCGHGSGHIAFCPACAKVVPLKVD